MNEDRMERARKCMAWAKDLARELGPEWVHKERTNADGEVCDWQPSELARAGGGSVIISIGRLDGRYGVRASWPRLEGNYDFSPRSIMVYGSTHDGAVPIRKSAELVRRWVPEYLRQYAVQYGKMLAQKKANEDTVGLAQRIARALGGRVAGCGPGTSQTVYAGDEYGDCMGDVRVQHDNVCLALHLTEEVALRVIAVLPKTKADRSATTFLPPGEY